MQTDIDNKIITIYTNERQDAPIVFSNDVSDIGTEILQACEHIDCPPFHYVSITELDWNAELSPWPHKAVMRKGEDFAGGADHYLETLETQIVPYVKTVLPGSQPQILQGYSMGGLFALYAAQKSTCFDAYAAPSGSVWYPEFVSYVCDHDDTAQLQERDMVDQNDHESTGKLAMPLQENSSPQATVYTSDRTPQARVYTSARAPQAIYLSLGDKESATRHPLFSQTEENMRRLCAYYEQQGIRCTFELNSGNHFTDVPQRIAKGLQWVLEEIC